MTPIALPPPYNPPTSSAPIIAPTPDLVGMLEYDDLVEETMDYSPVAAGELAAPDFPDEVWVEDDSGPMGF